MFRVKICGVTRPEEAREIATLGADAIGLNFYPKSKRFVESALATEIARPLADSLAIVGVFVNASVDAILHLCEQIPLHWVQLHGDETSDDATALVPLLHERKVQLIKAFRLPENDPGHSVERFVASCPELDGVLLDAYSTSAYGGTGHPVNWTVAAQLARTLVKPVILAGGLGPDNVVDAIQSVRPWGVDTASGVELAPGQKDIAACRAFIDRARSAYSL